MDGLETGQWRSGRDSNASTFWTSLDIVGHFLAVQSGQRTPNDTPALEKSGRRL
jgi:hypothetical protein